MAEKNSTDSLILAMKSGRIKRRRRRWKADMILWSHCLCLPLFFHCLPLAICTSPSTLNCTLTASNYGSLEPSRLECPSLSAFNTFTALSTRNSTRNIGQITLQCGTSTDVSEADDDEKQANKAVKWIKEEFTALRDFSVHNCSNPIAIHFAALPHLDQLNLSGNSLNQLGWQQIGARQLRLLDLRQNQLDCGNCQNAWMRGDLVDGNSKNAGWPIRSIFATIPDRILGVPRNCTFAHCTRESAKIESNVPSTLALYDRLELKCQFHTENALSKNATGIFVWPFRADKEEANNFDDDTQHLTDGTLLLPEENAALLRISSLESHHLGPVACRCHHCNTPTFDVLELRFPVRLSAHIPAGQTPGDKQLILHGFPLEGAVRIEATNLEENRTETHVFGSGNDEGDQHHNQPEAQLFFNGSLAIRPEPAHDQFFLRYFSLSIHECAHCSHAQTGGLFRFRICVKNGTNTSAENCASIEHRLEPPAHAVSRKKDFHIPENNSNDSPISLLHLLISIPPVLLSLALLALGARTAWRLKQRMVIREKLKRRTRRASRNTQRTEETSIPLDTMSRSLSLSNYIQSQLHVPLIDSRELQLNERIGKGAFGEVHVAIWRQRSRTEEGEPMLVNTHDSPHPGERRVAVKMLTSVQMDAEMDREAALLARLEHPNVLRMFGIAHWSGQIALVLELMNLGDLRNYLRNREPRCNNYAQFPPALLPTELVNICIQICEGLCYLAAQPIVHRDLAARNCLVSGESDMRSCSAAFRPPICIKISDFGMSRRLYASAEYYRMQDKKTALPVRWMPPECLSSGKFTPQSDIWSFGVLLYEVFSYGGMPFAALSNGEVLTAVMGGMRPEVPERCAPELAELMRECWHRSAQKRISAQEALQRLRQIQERGPTTALTGNGQAGKE